MEKNKRFDNKMDDDVLDMFADDLDSKKDSQSAKGNEKDTMKKGQDTYVTEKVNEAKVDSLDLGDGKNL